MEIRKLSLKQGAEQAEGVSVVIDVFRAFSCEPLMFHLGAAEILLEADVEKCLALQRATNGILVGEKDELPIPGFHLTNSPYLILQKGKAFFQKRTVIHRTTSGVTGALIALERSSEVLLGSFMTARAIAGYLKRLDPPLVSIVAMGIRSQSKAPEDEACAGYIESLLTGKPFDMAQSLGVILAHETAQKFLRGDKPYLPKEDVAISLQRDLFDFVLRAARHGEHVKAEIVSPKDGQP
jgi:2-phosphosulfolactate phosphatase